MFLIKVTLFCCLTFQAFLLAANVGDYKNIYLKAFRCNASEKFAYSNVTCFAKSFSRNVSIVNAYLVARFPLYNINVSKI